MGVECLVLSVLWLVSVSGIALALQQGDAGEGQEDGGSKGWTEGGSPLVAGQHWAAH